MSKVPISGDLICFATGASGELVAVQWTENLNTETATYCKIRARWGTNQDDVTNIHKEVDIYIATEYYLPTYMGQNPEHILNFHSLKDGKVTEKLDSRFFYGQSYGGKKRFVVYHPNLREPYQGRFRKSTLCVAFAGLADLLPDLEAALVKIKLQPKKFALAAAALILTCFGDRLHRFSGDPAQPDSIVVDIAYEKGSDEYDVTLDPRFANQLEVGDDDGELPDVPNEGSVNMVPWSAMLKKAAK